MTLAKINHEQKLYVIESGKGFSCYGFDVLDRKAKAIAAWMKAPGPTAAPGTAEHYAECMGIMAAGAKHAAQTHTRCECELTPQLIGLENRRVEVRQPDGTKSRFWVGKSTGWMPIHLEIKTRRSSGGGGVYFPAGSTVHLVS